MKKYISCFLLLFHYGISLAQVASFDTTFNGIGESTNCNFTLPYTTALNSSAFQSNGKIVCFGGNYTGCNISLVRFNVDGTNDSSFGTNGVIENTMCSIFINFTS